MQNFIGLINIFVDTKLNHILNHEWVWLITNLEHVVTVHNTVPLKTNFGLLNNLLRFNSCYLKHYYTAKLFAAHNIVIVQCTWCCLMASQSVISDQLKLIKMRAEVANLNDCAAPFLSRAAVNLSWYNLISKLVLGRRALCKYLTRARYKPDE